MKSLEQLKQITSDVKRFKLISPFSKRARVGHRIVQLPKKPDEIELSIEMSHQTVALKEKRDYMMGVIMKESKLDSSIISKNKKGEEVERNQMSKREMLEKLDENYEIKLKENHDLEQAKLKMQLNLKARQNLLSRSWLNNVHYKIKSSEEKVHE